MELAQIDGRMVIEYNGKSYGASLRGTTTITYEGGRKESELVLRCYASRRTREQTFDLHTVKENIIAVAGAGPTYLIVADEKAKIFRDTREPVGAVA